jgi:secretion/DNA translocation related TadE-like protein
MATVMVIAVGGMVAAAAAASVLLGGLVVARHRAGAAADLAAIAAAQHALDGQSAACRAASVIARDNGASVDSCGLVDGIAELRVQVAIAGPFARLGPARATARAGPAKATEPK